MVLPIFGTRSKQTSPREVTDSVRRVAIHGFTGSNASWPADWRLNQIPLTGHHPNHFFGEKNTFESEVHKICTQITEATHLIGYSCGGRLALAAALRKSTHIKRLSLISTHPGLSTSAERSHRQEQDKVWIDILEQEGIQNFVERWERIPLWDTQQGLPQSVLNEQKNIRLSHDPVQLAQSLKTVGLAAMPNFRPRLPELEIPVDLIIGESDSKFLALAHGMHLSLIHI